MPAFGTNFNSVAGNWQGWNQEEVKTRVMNAIEQSKSGVISRSMRNFRFTRLLGDDWNEIKQMLAAH